MELTLNSVVNQMKNQQYYPYITSDEREMALINFELLWTCYFKPHEKKIFFMDYGTEKRVQYRKINNNKPKTNNKVSYTQCVKSNIKNS